MAVPVIESYSSDTTAGTANTSLSFSMPTGLTTGDLILVFVANENANVNDWPTISSPDAYTQIAHGNNSQDVQGAIYWRVCTDTETWPLSVSVSGGGDYAVGWCFRISGVNATPINQTGTWAGVGSTSSSLTATEVTTDVAECLAFAFFATDGSDISPSSLNTGAGWPSSPDYSLEDPTNDANGVGADIYTKSIPSAGGTTDITVDFGGTDGTIGIQIAIAPSAGDGSSVNPTTGAVNVVTYAPTVVKQDNVVLSGSIWIGDGGENTTAQLDAPATKTTGDFDAGRIQDDVNPTTDINITADHYTEVEWSIKFTNDAALGDVYEFRVTDNGTVLDTYTVTPVIVLSATGEQTTHPTVGVITVTGYAPAISLKVSHDLTPNTGEISVTSSAPTLKVYVSHETLPATSDINITGNIPSVIAGSIVDLNPTTGAIDVTTYAPLTTREWDYTLLPSAGLETLTGYPPTIESTAIRYVNPVTGQVNVTGYAASLEVVNTLTIAGSVETVEGQVPYATTSAIIFVEPLTSDHDVVGYIPSIVAENELTITSLLSTHDVVGYTPSVSKEYTVSTNPGTNSVIGNTASIQTFNELTVTPSQGDENVTGYAPTVQAVSPIVIAASQGVVEVVGHAPSVNTSQQTQPIAGRVDVTGYAPTIGLTANLQPANNVIQLSGYLPSVDTGQQYTPQRASITVTGLAPVVDLRWWIPATDTPVTWTEGSAAVAIWTASSLNSATWSQASAGTSTWTEVPDTSSTWTTS